MTNRFFYIILLFATFIVGCTSHSVSQLQIADGNACGMDMSKLTELDSVINKSISENIIPGAVISVVKGDKIVYLKAYGNRQTVPSVEPMTTETVFDLASLSKCLGTTPSILKLVEEEKISIDDNVNQYLPDFKPWIDTLTGRSADITIHHLMTHTSGLDPEIIVNDFISRFNGPEEDSLVSFISNEVGRNFEPGSNLLYSCVNFLTLQLILEKVTGERLCDFAKDNFYDKLNLTHTGYLPSSDLISDCAATEVQPDGMPLVGVVHDPTARVIKRGNSGNAGLFSNANDLSYLAAALMNGGEIDGKRILSTESVRLMTTVPDNIDSSIGRTYGWDKDSPSSYFKGNGFSDNTICHTGYTGTSMVLDMDSKVAVILLTNRVHPYDEGSIGKLRTSVSDIVSSSIK